MQKLVRRLLPVFSAPLLASCVFLLDYDALQGGPPPAAGGAAAGGVPTAGTAPGGAGAAANTETGGAGGSASCGDCDDKNPCTIDTCDTTGDAPTCMHEATLGLKLDGFDTVLEAEQHVRVSLVGSGQLFYLAELEVNAGTPKVALYQLASDGTALEPLGTDLKLEGSPVSNVGLAIEQLAAGEVALHGFVATKLRPGAQPRVFHLENRAGQTSSNAVGASYRADNPSVFPQALAIGGEIVGAWIQADGTVAVHHIGTAKTDSFGDAMLPATTLSLLSTSDNLPAVMFTASAMPKQALGTYVETLGHNRVKLAECETQPGDYLSSSVIGTQLPGVWLAQVTRAGDGYLTSGNGTLVCGNNACAAAAEDCVKNPPPNALREVAGDTVHFDTDAAGIIYSVIALPQVAPKADDPNTAEGKLSLALGRIDLSNPSKAQSTKIGGDASGLMEVAHNDTSLALAFAGPDWPAVSILPTEQVAVAWIQPNAAKSGTELHVQRYKMCLPTQ